MTEQIRATGPTRVSDDGVWRMTKLVFGASALLFLVTITLGFLNVFTTGALPRWQLLVHLHSATLGWITLSAFGATVWLFTGERSVSGSYVVRVRWLARVMIAAFVGLIASFGIAFSQGGDAFYLLAVFAPLAALTIWAAATFFLHQLSRLPVVTTAHLLTAAGFVVLALAVVFGNVMALGRAGILSVPDFALTGHVFGILGYQVLIVTGIIEWLVVRDRDRWTRAGALQVGLGVLLGIWMPILLVLLVAGLPEGLLPMFLIFGILIQLVLFGLLFFGRVGVRALRTNSLTAGVEAWVFFATLWFAVGVVSFPLRSVLGDPAWWMVFNAHATNVGIVTNMIFGVMAARTRFARAGNSWIQPAAMWLMNAGIVVFVGLFIATGSAHGALVMGTGVLLGVGWALYSLRETSAEADTATKAGVETTD
jgi:hypothetical protein